MKTTFTYAEFMSSRGCYSIEQAANLIGDKKELTIDDILYFDIPLKDKSWFVRNSCELTIAEKREFAIGCALIVLPIYENKYPDNKSPRKAIEAAQAYLANEISVEELREARRAAAAYAAAVAAAVDAAAYAYAAADAAAYAVAAAYAAAVAAAAYAYAAAAYADAAAYAAAAADAAADAADRVSYKDQLLQFLRDFSANK